MNEENQDLPVSKIGDEEKVTLSDLVDSMDCKAK